MSLEFINGNNSQMTSNKAMMLNFKVNLNQT